MTKLLLGAVGIGLAAVGLFGLDALVAYTYRPPRLWVEWSGWVSHLGSGATVLGVGGLLIVLAWLRRDDRLWRCGASLLIGVLVGGALNFILKSLIGRLRPYAGDSPWAFLAFDPLTFAGARQSFPSGHAVVMGVSFEVFRQFYPFDRWLRWGVGCAAVAVCLARVTGRFHYPSDVVAGFLFGAWVGRQVTDRLARPPSRASTDGPTSAGLSDGGDGAVQG